MKQNRMRRCLQFFLCFIFAVPCYCAYGAQAEKFPVGKKIAQFTVGTPDCPETQQYLGLKTSDPFTLSHVGAKLVVLEFVSAF